MPQTELDDNLRFLKLQRSDNFICQLMNRHFLPMMFMIQRAEVPPKRMNNILDLMYTEPVYSLYKQKGKIIPTFDKSLSKDTVENFQSLVPVDRFFIALIMISFTRKILGSKNCIVDLSSLIKLCKIYSCTLSLYKPYPYIFVVLNEVLNAFPSSLIEQEVENYTKRIREQINSLNATNFTPNDKIMCEEFLTFSEIFLKRLNFFVSKEIITTLDHHNITSNFLKDLTRPDL